MVLWNVYALRVLPTRSTLFQAPSSCFRTDVDGTSLRHRRERAGHGTASIWREERKTGAFPGKQGYESGKRPETP